MKDITNYQKLEQIFNTNKGFITRQDVDEANIPSWFLSDFIKRNKLQKVAPGFYADNNYIVDDYYILQRRYPKYIFSGLSALFILDLIDRIPADIEVSAPQGYNPARQKIDSLIIHKISNKDIYELGIKEVSTIFNNIVKTYDEERTICEIIKNRDKFDSETFIKAVKNYVNKINNQTKLFRYARALGIEKKVQEIIEVISNIN